MSSTIQNPGRTLAPGEPAHPILKEIPYKIN
jgi:hypothetical protein